MSQKSLHFYQCKQCRASSARTFETDFTNQPKAKWTRCRTAATSPIVRCGVHRSEVCARTVRDVRPKSQVKMIRKPRRDIENVKILQSVLTRGNLVESRGEEEGEGDG